MLTHKFSHRPDAVTRTSVIRPFYTQQNYNPGVDAQNVVNRFTTAFTPNPSGPGVQLSGADVANLPFPDPYEAMAMRIATQFAQGRAVSLQAGSRKFTVNSDTRNIGGLVGQLLARAHAMIGGMAYNRVGPNLTQTPTGAPFTPGANQAATLRAAFGTNAGARAGTMAYYVKGGR